MKLRRLGSVVALGWALAITVGAAAQGAQTVNATVAAGSYPIAVAVNPATNKIYVANQGGNVTVIDGAKSTTAKVAAAPTASTNLITNGDFESGNTGFTSGYAFGNVHGPGTYWIGGTPSQAPGAWGGWYNGGDHTSGSGKMMVVNGANDALLPV